jgi:hypothetical protein
MSSYLWGWLVPARAVLQVRKAQCWAESVVAGVGASLSSVRPLQCSSR